VAVQLGLLGWLFAWAKLLGHDVPNWTLLRTLEPTAVITLACLVEVAVMLSSHDVISDIRNQYDAN
jgi:hypothetical protein